jgi:glycosyltransferase involved in cell wall biosynthesis
VAIRSLTGLPAHGDGPSGARLVSVVLPVHDGERYLREALDSVVEQDHRPLELVVVDDGSADASGRIADEAAARHPFVRVLHLSPNRGLPAALNAGFAACRGEYLTWTSDDNRYRPRALSALAAFLDAHPEADVVYADMTRIDEEGRPQGPWGAGPAREIPHRNPVGACFLYRRRVQEALGGYAEDLATVEDFDFWVRAASRFTLVPLHEDLYEYRLHGASLSSTRAAGRDDLMVVALRRALPGMPRRLRARTHQQLALLLRRGGRKGAALGHLLAALGLAPFASLAREARVRLGRV